MKKILVLAAVPLLTLACMHSKAMSGPMASATIESKSSSAVKGTVSFMEAKDGTVTVKIDLTGLTPGVHGFHVHDKGDCSAPDATSAGGHFNPMSMQHGAPDATSHHAGDLGNVTADNNGEVHMSTTTHSLSVSAGPNSVVGKAVIVHADPDDFQTQPTGNAGKRVGCGVVTMAGGMQAH